LPGGTATGVPGASPVKIVKLLLGGPSPAKTAR
jgi:hypothetical protein